MFVSHESPAVAYFKFDCLNRKTILGNKWKKHLSVDIAKKIMMFLLFQNDLNMMKIEILQKI